MNQGIVLCTTEGLVKLEKQVHEDASLTQNDTNQTCDWQR